MRRVKAILVIVALLSLPLAVLAQSASEDMPSCGGMCCLPHQGAHHLGPQHTTSGGHNHGKSSAACEHGSPAPMNCAFNCGNTHAVHFFVSPLAPTKPSNLVSVESLEPPAAAKFHLESANILPGFLSTPFQPPRA
jgi:phage tail sheath gpL-like